MSKAILVMDMPDSCGNCPILEYCHDNDVKSDLSIKQSWCPLKKLPEEKPIYIGEYYYDPFSTSSKGIITRKDDYGYGYNQCIKDILE